MMKNLININKGKNKMRTKLYNDDDYDISTKKDILEELEQLEIPQESLMAKQTEIEFSDTKLAKK